MPAFSRWASTLTRKRDCRRLSVAARGPGPPSFLLGRGSHCPSALCSTDNGPGPILGDAGGVHGGPHKPSSRAQSHFNLGQRQSLCSAPISHSHSRLFITSNADAGFLTPTSALGRRGEVIVGIGTGRPGTTRDGPFRHLTDPVLHRAGDRGIRLWAPDDAQPSS